MAKEVIPIHGPDHCPGGPDPIPCFGIAWIRLKACTVQTITGDGIGSVVVFQEEFNDYPEIFETELFGDDIAVVHPLIDGLYQITTRIYWEDLPTTGFEMLLNGVDWDEWTEYSSWISGETTSLSGYAEAIFRASPITAFAAETSFFTKVNQNSGTDCDTSSFGGTYMEVRRLGSVTVNNRDNTCGT